MLKPGKRWRGLALPVIVALCVAPAAAAQDSPAVLTVNDPAGTRTVTRAELDHWMEIASSSGGPHQKRQLRAQVLQMLSSTLWIEGEARALGLTVSDAQVKAAFEKQKRAAFPREVDFRRFLRGSGQTVKDLLLRVRVDLLSDRLRDHMIAPVTVTDAEIDKFITEKAPAVRPERRDVRAIRTATRAAALQARRALEQGAAWAQVARRYAIDKSDGRVMRGVTKGSGLVKLDRAVFRARRGQMVGPVKTIYGYYVAKVVRIRPAKPIPLAKHRRTVREILLSEAQQDAITVYVEAFTETWKERTVCAPAFVWFNGCANWDGTELR